MLEVGPVVTTERVRLVNMAAIIGRVYLITNKVNGKQYVGFTSKSIQTRWMAHQKGGPDAAKRLHRAIVEYGPAAFSVEQVFEGTKDEALAKEHELILAYNTFPGGYNGSEGGEAPYLGKTTPVEVRAKISDSLGGNKFNLGKKASAETRANMSRSRMGNRSNLGRKLSAQHRAHIAAGLKGKRLGIPKTQEHIEKQRLAMTGRKLTPEHKTKIGSALKGNSNSLGRKWSSEQRATMSRQRKGKQLGNQHFAGRTHSEETKAKMRTLALTRESQRRTALASALGINVKIEKRCSKCRIVKSLKDFYRTSRTHDGLHNECKTCSK